MLVVSISKNSTVAIKNSAVSYCYSIKENNEQSALTFRNVRLSTETTLTTGTVDECRDALKSLTCALMSDQKRCLVRTILCSVSALIIAGVALAISHQPPPPNATQSAIMSLQNMQNDDAPEGNVVNPLGIMPDKMPSVGFSKQVPLPYTPIPITPNPPVASSPTPAASKPATSTPPATHGSNISLLGSDLADTNALSSVFKDFSR